MNVLVVTSSLRPIGGAEIYVGNCISALAARGHRVTAISADSVRPSGIEGLAHWVSMADLFSTSLRPVALRRAWRAARHLRNHVQGRTYRVALAHMFDAPQGFFSLAASVPTIRFVHTAWPYCPAGTRWLPRSDRECSARASLACLRINREERCLVTTEGIPFGLKNSVRRILDLPLQRFMFLRSSAVVANSEYMASQLRAIGVPSDRIAVILPSVPSPSERKGVPVAGRLILAGRRVRLKGPADALHVAAAIPHATLTVAGDGPLRTELERLAVDLGIADRVWFTGWLTQAELDEQLQLAEVVLFPSHWPETFGQLGVQAARNGRAVVAYDVGGVRSWLSERTGVLVPANDLSALIRAATALVRQPSRALELGAAALVSANRFDVETYAQRLDELIVRVSPLTPSSREPFRSRP